MLRGDALWCDRLGHRTRLQRSYSSCSTEYGSKKAADRTALDKPPTSQIGPVNTRNALKDVPELAANSVEVTSRSLVTHRNPDRSAHVAAHAEERASHADERAFAAAAASASEVALGISANSPTRESPQKAGHGDSHEKEGTQGKGQCLS